VQAGSKPIILDVSPASTLINVAATVTITGGGFASGSVIKLDGNTLAAPVFIDDTHMRVTIPSFAVPGAKAITVTTGALTSNAVNFLITAT
jgi:hypothetical protein